MKIRFVVLLAIVCLCAHVASASGGDEKSMKPERPEREKYETEDEEVEVIHHSKKKDKEKKQEKKVVTEVVHKKKEKKAKVVVPCSELPYIQNLKADCETKDVPEGYKAIFVITSEADCAWKCDYDALPTTAAPTTVAPKKLKKPKKQPKKALKECSGEQKIHASNCLFKLNGLIAWGGKTKNFEKKWEKFLAKAKTPKGGSKKKPAKKGKKKADKKPAADGVAPPV